MPSPSRRNILGGSCRRIEAVADALQDHWPDAWFAARFLRREQREAATCVFAVMRQLGELLCGEACDSQSCTCEPTSERQRVAMAILDHLWRGEPTGKTELDAFAVVVRAHGLERAWFERAIEAMGVSLPPRVATWKRLRESIEATVSPLTTLVAKLLGAGDATPQMVALGTAMRLTRLLERVRDDAAAGRLTLPLDDLVKCSMTDADVSVMTEPDPRWRMLVELQAARAQALFDGGAKAIASVSDAHTRRAVAVLIELERRRLRRCIEAMRLCGAARKDATLGERLRSLPRAMRAAMKGPGA